VASALAVPLSDGKIKISGKPNSVLVVICPIIYSFDFFFNFYCSLNIYQFNFVYSQFSANCERCIDFHL
jgi:hypothetical protein